MRVVLYVFISLCFASLAILGFLLRKSSIQVLRNQDVSFLMLLLSLSFLVYSVNWDDHIPMLTWLEITLDIITGLFTGFVTVRSYRSTLKELK
jgi:hypothetical protein